MDDLVLDQEELKEKKELYYAGFGVRFWAYLVDTIILGLFQGIVARLYTGYWFNIEGNMLLSYGSVFIPLAYYTVMNSSPYQATLGKIMMGIKVVDLQGQRVSYARALGRYFSKFVSAVILLIGFIMVVFDAKKRSLHDMIAGTYVVDH